MSALTEASEDEIHDTLLAARARIEHLENTVAELEQEARFMRARNERLEAEAAAHQRDVQLAYMTGASHGHDKAVRECIARLEAGFGANCAPVTTLKHHFNVQLVERLPADDTEGGAV